MAFRASRVIPIPRAISSPMCHFERQREILAKPAYSVIGHSAAEIRNPLPFISRALDSGIRRNDGVGGFPLSVNLQPAVSWRGAATGHR